MFSFKLKQYGAWFSLVMTLTVAGVLTGCSSSSDSSSDDSAPSSPVASDEQSADSSNLAWSNLAGTDGKTHSLTDLADAKAVAVVFTCNRCPVAVKYEDRLVELANDYREKGVPLVAINVNDRDGEQLPDMKARAEEKGFPFAYLYEPNQDFARAYEAIVTPHAFLLDGQREIVYRGAIDDNAEADQVTTHYLRDAIDAVLAGNKPAVAEQKPVGCGIKFK